MSPSILHYFKRKKSPSPPPSSRPLRPLQPQPHQQQQQQRPAASTAAQATPQPPQGSPVNIPSLVRPTFSPSPSPSPSQDDEQESVPKQDKGKGKEKEQQDQSADPPQHEYQFPDQFQDMIEEDRLHCEKLIQDYPADPNDPVYKTDAFEVAIDEVLTEMHRDSKTQSIRHFVVPGTHYLLDPIHRKATVHILSQYFRPNERQFFMDAHGSIYARTSDKPLDFSLLHLCNRDTGRGLYLGHGGMSNEAGENHFFVNLAKSAKKDIDAGRVTSKSSPFLNCENKEEVMDLLRRGSWLAASRAAGIELWYAGVCNSQVGWWSRKSRYEYTKFNPQKAQFSQKRAFGNPKYPNPPNSTILPSSFQYYEFGGPIHDSDHISIPVLLESINTYVTRSLSYESKNVREINAELGTSTTIDYAHIGVSKLNPLIPSFIHFDCRDFVQEFRNAVLLMRTPQGFPLKIHRYRPEKLRCRINLPSPADTVGIPACPLEIPTAVFTRDLGIESISEPFELSPLYLCLDLDGDDVGVSFLFEERRYSWVQLFKTPEPRDAVASWYWRVQLAQATGTLDRNVDEALQVKAQTKIAELEQTKLDRESAPTYETDKKIDDEIFGLGFPATIHISTGVTGGTKLTIRPLESLKHRLRFYDNGIIQVKLTATPQKALKKLLDDTKVTINGRRQSIAEAITRSSGSRAKQECWITLGSPSSLSITIPDFNFVIPDAILPDTKHLRRFRKRAELVVRKEAGGVAEGRRFYRSSDRSWKDAQEESAYDTWFRTNRKGPKYAQWATPSSTSSAATSSAPAATSSAPVTSSSSVAVPSTSSSTGVASTSRVKKSVNKISSFFKKPASSSAAPPPPPTTSSSTTSQPLVSAPPVASSSAPAPTSSLSVAAPPSNATPSSSNPVGPTVPLPSTSTSKLEMFRYKGKEIDSSVRGNFGGI